MAISTGASFKYTNSAGVGEVYENSDLSIAADGYGVPYLFGAGFANRTFNGTVHYYLE